MTAQNDFKDLKQIIQREIGIVRKLENAAEKGNGQQEWIVELQQTNNLLLEALDKIQVPQAVTMNYSEDRTPALPSKKDKAYVLTKAEIQLERDVIKRLKRGEKQVAKKKIRKPNHYVRASSSLFSGTSIELYKTKMFKTLRKDLVQANLPFLPVSYISTILYTTMWATVISFVLFVFFLFFNVSTIWPKIIYMSAEPILERLAKVIWILIIVPLGTFLLMYLYPSMERRSLENKINQELPFVMINMSAISGSMIEPSKIFEIIVSTGEFHSVSREFRKVINEVNVHGYDLVSALRETAANTASRKLADLFNGLATSITSGGDLPKFFEERAKSFLFEYRLERERNTRSAETFMDIYISVVIAAPMMLMLLLMMINIGGLGLPNLGPGVITLIMVLGVTGLNILFITFLYLKQPTSS